MLRLLDRRHREALVLHGVHLHVTLLGLPRQPRHRLPRLALEVHAW
tara:strand:- start:346 stop:483 length:138 start_codon:yes stop_codon:yes gene_type:complete